MMRKENNQRRNEAPPANHTKSGPGRRHKQGPGTLGHGVLKGIKGAHHWKGSAFRAKLYFRQRLVLELQRAGLL